MSVVQFCWTCVATAVQGMIGLALMVLLLWGVLKLFRPESKFPRPVIYRSQVKSAAQHRDQ